MTNNKIEEYLKAISKDVLMVKTIRIKKCIDNNTYLSEDSLSEIKGPIVVFSLLGEQFYYHHHTFVVCEKVEIENKKFLTFKSLNNEFVLFVPYESRDNKYLE